MKEILTLAAAIGMAGATALFVILGLAAIFTGNDYRKEGDHGAALACFGCGIFMAMIAVAFGILTTKMIF